MRRCDCRPAITGRSTGLSRAGCCYSHLFDPHQCDAGSADASWAGKKISAALTLAAGSLRRTLPRNEFRLQANNANLRPKTLRAHQMWNYLYAAPVEQRPLLARHETMRSYIVITAIALGLLAVWAARPLRGLITWQLIY
jgi:hypothetical protein